MICDNQREGEPKQDQTVSTHQNSVVSDPIDHLDQPATGLSNRLSWLAGVLLVLGLVALVAPLAAAVFAETMLAISVFLAGVAHVVHALQSHGWRIGEMAWGVVLAIGGVVLFAFPMEGVMTMTLVLAISMIAEGLAKMLTAVKFLPTQHRLCFLLDGAFGLIVGVLIWANWPSDATWVIGTLVGIRLIASGVSTQWLGNALNTATLTFKP